MSVTDQLSCTLDLGELLDSGGSDTIPSVRRVSIRGVSAFPFELSGKPPFCLPTAERSGLKPQATPHLAAAVLETSVYLRRRKAANCSVLYCIFSNCYPLHVAVVLFLFFVFCSL